MTTIKYTLNKRSLNKERRDRVSKYYRGLTALSDTLTETHYDENGNRTNETTYYVFKGSWVPYGACVKRNGYYVFARYSRYDALSEDFTEFLVDCEDDGTNSKCFETKHVEVKEMTVKY